jgi:hypothetical protein
MKLENRVALVTDPVAISAKRSPLAWPTRAKVAVNGLQDKTRLDEVVAQIESEGEKPS